MSGRRNPIYKSRPVAPLPAKLGGERFNDFISLSEGSSNAYLIETSEGNIQINAGIFYDTPVFARNFDQSSAEPVRYLILTQGHVDHVGGVEYFRQKHPGLKVIATDRNVEHQAYDQRLAPFRRARSNFAFKQSGIDAILGLREAGIDDMPVQDRPVPDIVFNDRFSFRLGELDVELIAVPGAETNDSLIVWLPQHKICFTGNLFGCPFGHFPNLITIRGDRYRDALVCAEAVQTVMNLGAETILYGHHAPVVGGELIREELSALRGAILAVHDQTVEGMNAGKDVHTLMAEIEIPPEFEVGQGYGKVSWGVRAIWEHYAGWFHHGSTTELYAVPAKAIDSDLLELAGGVEPVIDRAREKLSKGRHEEALHLLDIVLREAPGNARARETAKAAHEALLEESENFWLSAWLRHQIKTLDDGGAD